MNQKLINFGMLVFRISISSLMLFGHGLGKLQKALSGSEIKFLDPFGLGSTISFYMVTFAEFFSSILIILGLFTRLGSFSLIIAMSVAAFIAHADDPFASKEKAIMYLMSYLLIFIVGPGKFSIQKWFDKKINISNKILKSIIS